MSITVACCVPKQEKDRGPKLGWLRSAVERTDCDLFLAPQEYFGGHAMCPHDLHVPLSWIREEGAKLARETKKAVGIGAATLQPAGGATEDYHYFDRDGTYCGYHRKFALPSYDDVRTKGGGNLWPEVSYQDRIKPVGIKTLGLKIGTIFCWEVFALTIAPAYCFAGCNLIAHPIKFAPRGWLKLSSVGDAGGTNIVGFDQQAKSQIWVDRLVSLGRHETMCPIAVSCNTWNIGPKFMALCGHVDELRGTTKLLDLPSTPEQEHIHTFEMNPAWYNAARTAMHSMGAFKEACGTVDGYHELGEWKMHAKMIRLEAQLIGNTTRLDCRLLVATRSQQKKSTIARAAKRLSKSPRK